jgi:hypothetical protein
MFVHSLVRVTHRKKAGWKAPVELGDETPAYISFVVPLDDTEALADEYTCEIAKVTASGRTIESGRLLKAGSDSFVLKLSSADAVRFHVRGVARTDRRLPYVGTLKHDDFARPLAEIVPAHNSALDRLFEQHGMFIIGCDPDRHYAGKPDAPHVRRQPVR